MHEIGTHVIDIQISENTTIIYSNDIKITWNQVAISLCKLLCISWKRIPQINYSVHSASLISPAV